MRCKIIHYFTISRILPFKCFREEFLMKKRKIWQPYLLRPAIYLAAFRLMVGAIIVLALSYIPNGPRYALTCGFLAVGFALLAYLVHLRLDGLGIPRMKYMRPKKKDDSMAHATSPMDHADDAPIPFEELEPEEKDLCSLIANLACLAVFTVASFLL